MWGDDWGSNSSSSGGNNWGGSSSGGFGSGWGDGGGDGGWGSSNNSSSGGNSNSGWSWGNSGNSGNSGGNGNSGGSGNNTGNNNNNNNNNRNNSLGTKGYNFKPASDLQQGKRSVYQSICYLKEFSNKSPEELRFEDLYGKPSITPGGGGNNTSNDTSWNSWGSSDNSWGSSNNSSNTTSNNSSNSGGWGSSTSDGWGSSGGSSSSSSGNSGWDWNSSGSNNTSSSSGGGWGTNSSGGNTSSWGGGGGSGGGSDWSWGSSSSSGGGNSSNSGSSSGGGWDWGNTSTGSSGNSSSSGDWSSSGSSSSGSSGGGWDWGSSTSSSNQQNNKSNSSNSKSSGWDWGSSSSSSGGSSGWDWGSGSSSSSNKNNTSGWNWGSDNKSSSSSGGSGWDWGSGSSSGSSNSNSWSWSSDSSKSGSSSWDWSSSSSSSGSDDKNKNDSWSFSADGSKNNNQPMFATHNQNPYQIDLSLGLKALEEKSKINALNATLAATLNPTQPFVPVGRNKNPALWNGKSRGTLITVKPRSVVLGVSGSGGNATKNDAATVKSTSTTRAESLLPIRPRISPQDKPKHSILSTSQSTTTPVSLLGTNIIAISPLTRQEVLKLNPAKIRVRDLPPYPLRPTTEKQQMSSFASEDKNRKETTTPGEESPDGTEDENIPIEKVCPKLTKPDYYCIPSIEEMKKMTIQELKRVKNFTIGHKRYGKVIFPGETDVRGHDLDVLVTFKWRAVQIYDDTDPSKPPIGKGLNKPAEVELYDVFLTPPPADENWKPTREEMQTLSLRLADVCANSDNMTFDSFDLDRGIWKFHLKHW